MSLSNLNLSTKLSSAVSVVSNKLAQTKSQSSPYTPRPKNPQKGLTEAEKNKLSDLKVRLRSIEDKIVRLEPIKDSPFYKESYEQAIRNRDNLKSEIKKLEDKAASAASNDEFERVAQIAAEDSRRQRVDQVFRRIGDDKYEEFRTEGLEGLRKRVRPNFERFAKNFVGDSPEILFNAEYYVADQFVGNLICFEKYKGATHYEVWKKNIFTNSDFERVIFLDSLSLSDETKNFIPYLRNTLGFKDLDFNNVFVVLDDQLKEDRIYKYRVVAARVPSDASDVDYDMILESKNLLSFNTLDRASISTLFDYAGVTLGSKDLAWSLAVVNETFSFFGKDPSNTPLSSLVGTNNNSPTINISTPRNLNDLLCIFQESISLFGLSDSFEHLLRVLGGLPVEFLESCLESVDEVSDSFSFSAFKDSIKQRVPVLNLVLDIAESGDSAAIGELSKLSVVLPANEGSRSLTSLVNLTNVLKVVNSVLISTRHAQDNFEKLKEIAGEIDRDRDQLQPEDLAIRDIRNDVSQQIVDRPISADVSQLYNVVLGSKSSNRVSNVSETVVVPNKVPDVKTTGFFALNGIKVR